MINEGDAYGDDKGQMQPAATCWLIRVFSPFSVFSWARVSVAHRNRQTQFDPDVMVNILGKIFGMGDIARETITECSLVFCIQHE